MGISKTLIPRLNFILFQKRSVISILVVKEDYICVH